MQSWGDRSAEGAGVGCQERQCGLVIFGGAIASYNSHKASGWNLAELLGQVLENKMLSGRVLAILEDLT
jgi:hypothetical protein